MVKRITRLAMLTAVALVLGYLDGLLQPLIPVPGAKLGLANVVTLVVLLSMTFWDALIILVIRTVSLAFLFGRITSLFYALPAGLMSLIVMVVLLRLFKKDSGIISISMISAVVHNMTQLVVAIFFLGSEKVLYMAPWLILLAVPAGLFVGFSAKYLDRYLSKQLRN